VSRLISRLANLAFEFLYGPAVPFYDWVSRVGFAGEWSRWQETTLRFIRTGPTLELGPGTGDLLPRLQRHGLQPLGLERSAQMIAHARRKFRAKGLPALPLVRGQVEAIPFAANSFGSVVATFPSAWVFRPATWTEIARVLRPGGDVAIVLGGELASDSFGRRLRTWVYRPLYGRMTNDLPPPPDSALGLRWEIVRTAHGQALLLVGCKPAPDRDTVPEIGYPPAGS
jgi:ubiquinone/menaquinone biosynthesis C-methylase UbiE